MIRDGVNPLQTSMEDLEEYLSGQDTYAEDSEKYSRFLYRLEQNNEITPEEKESFIGIYRLLRQVENPMAPQSESWWIPERRFLLRTC